MIDFQFVELTSWGTLRISGPEKLDYLNGIVTYELANLKSEGFKRCSFLTPQGKIRSIYWIAEIEDEYLIYCPPIMRENLIQDLLRFKLNMDVKLEDITDETDQLYLQISADVVLEGLSTKTSKFEFINLTSKPKSIIDYSNFKNFLIKGGVVPVDLMMDQLPYEVGLNDAITLDKGCFLGQEPVSRMFYRGRPRKSLYKFQADSEIKRSEIYQNDISVGKVVELIPDETGFVGISFINYQLADLTSIEQKGISISIKQRVGNYPEFNR